MKSSQKRNLNSVLLVTVSVIVGACSATAVIFMLSAFRDAGNATGSDTNLEQPRPNQSVHNEKVADDGERHVPSTRPLSTSKSLQSLEDLKQFESPFERRNALRSMLSEANAQQVLDLFEESLKISPLTPTQVQSVILQRLAQLNPRNALTRLNELNVQYKGELIGSIFSEWSRINLEEAVAQASSLDDSEKFSAMASIVEERTDLSEEKRRQIARQLGNEQYAINLILQEKVSDSTLDPGEAWNDLVDELQNDFLQSRTLVNLAIEWVKKSGLSVLDQVSESITDSQIRTSILSSVLTTLAQTNPEGAFEYALRTDTDSFSTIASSVVKAWARSDPEAALAAASQVDKSGLRRHLEQSVVDTWAHRKPREVLADLDRFADYLRRSASTSAIAAIAHQNPKEAAGLVASIEHDTSKTSTALMFVSIWSRKDSKATLEWVLNKPGIEQVRPYLLHNILFRVVDDDPLIAMETALEQPIGEESEGLEVRVIEALVKSDFGKALEFLPRVRKGQSQAAAYASVGGRYIRDGETQKALDLAQTLPESNRTNYLKYLLPDWARSDPKGLLSSIDRLPTGEIKSRAALALSVNDKFQQNLSKAELERAQKFLTEEDAARVEKNILSY